MPIKQSIPQPLGQTATGRTIYPPPSQNPACVCTNPLQSFWCATGHMLECHYPMSCDEANCSHMDSYGLRDAEAVDE